MFLNWNLIYFQGKSEKKFFICFRSDLIVHHFLDTVRIAFDRGFSFDFNHLFFNFTLNEGQFAASNLLLAHFYVQFCAARQISIPFDQFPNEFALCCIEQMLLKNPSVILGEILPVMLVAQKQRNFAAIRRVLSLLRLILNSF